MRTAAASLIRTVLEGSRPFMIAVDDRLGSSRIRYVNALSFPGNKCRIPSSLFPKYSVITLPVPNVVVLHRSSSLGGMVKEMHSRLLLAMEVERDVPTLLQIFNVQYYSFRCEIV